MNTNCKPLVNTHCMPIKSDKEPRQEHDGLGMLKIIAYKNLNMLELFEIYIFLICIIV